jgi:short-subunit dehydrogenase
VSGVVLTGATGGIGRLIAARLVARGTPVVVVARDGAALSALGGELRGLARAAVIAVPADVGTAAGRSRVVEAAGIAGCGAVIHAAGRPCFGALEEIDDAALEATVLTNLVAPIALTRALLPTLRRHAPATVLLIGSALGSIGVPGHAVYGATKAGIRRFAEALRRELAGSGVRVCHLAPRATRTAFNGERVDAFNRATGTASDTPGRVADAALRMLEGGAPERFLGFPEAWVARLEALAPTRLDGAFARHRAALHAARPMPGPVPTVVPSGDFE